MYLAELSPHHRIFSILKTVFKQECDLGQKLWQSDLLESHFQDDPLLFALGIQVPRTQGTEGNNNASTDSIGKKEQVVLGMRTGKAECVSAGF